MGARQDALNGWERVRVLEDSQQAMMNILEDFDAEKVKLMQFQNVMSSILDDFNEEKSKLEETYRAALNVLEDFELEKNIFKDGQKSTFNILEDFAEERLQLKQLQIATFNILDDLNEEKNKSEAAGKELQERNVKLKKADEGVRELNMALQERAQELELINMELEAFSYSVSHDLRAPLRAIDGFSQALIEDYFGQIDENGRHFLQRIREGAQRMARLIDDLLKLSRVTRSGLSREDVDLSELAQEVAAELLQSQKDRDVDFAIPPGIAAQGDKRLLRIALENLLGNAWKFTGPHPKAKIEFGVSEEGGKRVYFVRDDGVGFDMAYSAKLFGAFQRLHNNREFPGTGIGLATVRRVINRHGGHIWAEADVDKGATFYFTLK